MFRTARSASQRAFPTSRVGIAALALLAWQCAAQVPTDRATAAPAPSSEPSGWELVFNQRLGNCAACHSIPDQQGNKLGVQSTFAPALDGVASRYSAARLREWVADARTINPQTLMPPFRAILSERQIDLVVQTLQTLR